MSPARRSPEGTAASGGRRILRVILAAGYFGVGLVHLTRPDAFLPIMPDWVPQPRNVVLFTGACELAGATALMTRRFRWWAGIMLALYAVCVFPANLKHAIEDVNVPPIPSSWWYHAPRLLFQPVFVWWALFAGGVIDWPLGRARTGARDRRLPGRPDRTDVV